MKDADSSLMWKRPGSRNVVLHVCCGRVDCTPEDRLLCNRYVPPAIGSGACLCLAPVLGWRRCCRSSTGSSRLPSDPPARGRSPPQAYVCFSSQPRHNSACHFSISLVPMEKPKIIAVGQRLGSPHDRAKLEPAPPSSCRRRRRTITFTNPLES